MDAAQRAQAYIQQQLASGKTADVVANQLRAGGWSDSQITAAFTSLQSSIMPVQLQQMPLPVADGQRHGRIRTGWELFMASMRLLNGNRYLLRYLAMTSLWTFGCIIAAVVVIVATYYIAVPAAVLWPLAILTTYLLYFIINLYAAGLTANVLDLYKGNRQPYGQYMRQARSNWRALAIYSLISMSVGLFLQYVVERVRIVGWLLSYLFGVIWSVGNSFTIPLIVSGDKPQGLREIKQSFKLFKQTFGVNVVTKVSVNLPLFFINVGVILAFIPIFIFSFSTSYIWLLLAEITLLYVILFVIAVAGSYANSLINISMFYYVNYREVPPAFSKELLDSIYIKSRRALRAQKKAARATTG